MKKIIIAGGTGFIGRYLTTRFLENGYNVMIVSRSTEHLQWNVNELSKAFEKAELVINLAGKSINCRHTTKNRDEIIRSRIDTTTIIAKAIQNCEFPPELWINASATGIYPTSEHTPMTEDSPEENNFLANVVKKWEKALFDFDLTETRQIALRTSIVLGKNAGALKPLVILTRSGLGGKHANGKQMMSWIHVEDYFLIIQFAMENKTLKGVLNCTSPEPVSNRQFMKTLRKTLQIPYGLPAPKQIIQLGAKFFGTEPELILNSSYVLPERITKAGFIFTYPDLCSALIDLLI